MNDLTRRECKKPQIALILLACVVLIIGALACNLPRATPGQNQLPTVTPFIPLAATPTSEPSPTATAAPPTETPTPTPTLTPTPTATPKPVSQGPLDFVPPTWVHAWEELPDGGIRIVLKITITGGAPPFTILHGGGVDGQTWEREYYIDFIRYGCASIPQNITVQSADGQRVSKDYWIGLDQQPWCSD